jgi:cytochrome c oxidase accessory protein FixG
MCPYARFQSAMFDRNTLIISYDAKRGEPRGARKKGSLSSVLERPRGLIDERLAEHYIVGHAKENKTDAVISTGLVVDNFEDITLEKIADQEQLGDCIDCTICVQVCPTGIDIRNGLQYECIACGACIDACDEVMDKLGYPKGLVRYTTHNALVGHKVNLFRPRIIIYAVLLLGLLAGTIAGIALRKPLLVDVIRDNQLYRINDDGTVDNAYTLRLVNKRNETRELSVTLQESADILLVESPVRITAEPEQVVTLPITLRAPEVKVKGKRDIHFEIRAGDSEEVVIEESRFFGPTQ